MSTKFRNALLAVLLGLLPLTVFGELSSAQRIELAAQHILRMQLDSGLFIYEHDFLSRADSGDNNIVRQAGAAFSLGEYYAQTDSLPAKRAVANALDAFTDSAIAWQQGELLAFDNDPKQAKAGATALALLALLLTEKDDAALRRDRRLSSWIDGLLALQQADGGFAARPGIATQSAYSNGEIWLALAIAVDRLDGNHDADLTQAVVRADRRFTSHYQKQPDIGFFHWGMMAAAARYKTTRDPAFAAFIENQTRLFLDKLRPRTSRKSNSCYSVEGLLAGLETLLAAGGENKLTARIRKRVSKEMKKNRRLQILPGQQRIRFDREHYLVTPHLDRYAGAFLNGRYRPQIRIDATQHCLSAMLRESSLPK